jgi:hypothetical protein
MNYAVFQEQYSSGTNGESFTADEFNQSSLNTTIINTVAGCSLSSGDVSLPAGTYRVTGYVISGAHRIQAALYDFGNSVVLLNGLTSGGPVSGAGTAYAAMSVVDGLITLTAETTIGLNTYADSSGFAAAASSGQPEVYSQLLIQQYVETLV